MKHILSLILVLTLVAALGCSYAETETSPITPIGVIALTPARSVEIYCDARPTMTVGETITFWCELIGFEDIDPALIHYQWQIMVNGVISDIDGATSPVYAFAADYNCVGASFRLMVEWEVQ